jgi:hypothetical protein
VDITFSSWADYRVLDRRASWADWGVIISARWRMGGWSGWSPGWARRQHAFYGAIAAFGLTAVSSFWLTGDGALRRRAF